MKTLKTLFICNILFISFSVFAQKQANIWYFGNGAGIDFNSGYPVALPSSAMNTHEGCASMTDICGNLIFYTDGIEVYNKNHQVMPNGNNLKGDPSSAQSAIIIHKPGSKTIFYVFTVDGWGGPDGLNYSEVDMSLAGGLGDVTTKNVQLISPTLEKVTAVLHSNGTDIWVITHETTSDAFYAYLVTQTGVNTTPVISNAGSSYLSVYGAMKASPNGQKIAMANFSSNIEIFDFDNSNGILSNPDVIANQAGLPGGNFYGVEFSSSGDYLYLRDYNYPYDIFQFDMNAINIGLSNIHIGNMGGTGALQLGPDGKIYVGQDNSNFLSVIEQPDIQGVNCNLIKYNISLNGNSCGLGLPTYMQSYLYKYNASLFNPSEPSICKGDTTTIKVNLMNGPYYYSWSTGDTLESISVNPQSDTKYIVTYTDGHSSCSDSIMVSVGNPVLSLSSQNISCYGQNNSYIKANVSNGVGGYNYNWSNSIGNLDSIGNLNAGVYSLTVSDSANCTVSDSITIFEPDSIKVTSLTTNVKCFGDSTGTANISITGGTYPYIIDWGSSNFNALYAGTHSYLITDSNGCTYNDSIFISQPLTGINIDTVVNGILCPNDQNASITLNVTGGVGNINYLWSNGNTNSSINNLSSGIYSVTVSDSNICLDSISINIINPHGSVLTISQDTGICRGELLMISANATGNVTYQWSNGNTTSSFIASPSNTTKFYVTVNDQNNCEYLDSMELRINELPINYAGADTTIVGGSSVQLQASNGGVNYQWSPSDFLDCDICSDPISTPLNNISYKLEITDSNGCQTLDSINIIVDYNNKLFLPSAFSPNGDGNNDLLYVRGLNIDKFDFMIYNRFGNLVFSTNSLNEAWDGKYNGKVLSPDVFISKIHVTFIDGETRNYYGNVSLIR